MTDRDKSYNGMSISDLISDGYAVVNLEHGAVSRIDMTDAQFGLWMDRHRFTDYDKAADLYRRAHSRDRMTIPLSWAKVVPLSHEFEAEVRRMELPTRYSRMPLPELLKTIEDTIMQAHPNRLPVRELVRRIRASAAMKKAENEQRGGSKDGKQDPKDHD